MPPRRDQIVPGAAGAGVMLAQAIAEADALLADAAAEAPSGPGGEEPPVAPFGLTPREREVLRLIVEGRTDRQIGEALFIARPTVSKHVGSILAKLGVGTRAAAVDAAHRRGLA